MSNLIDELGIDYFNTRFHKSMFLDEEGRPSYVRETAGRHEVRVNTLVDDRPEELTLRRSFFKDMEVFATPTLGWRARDEGASIFYLARNNRSYHRGISVRNLKITTHPLSRALNAPVTIRSIEANTLSMLKFVEDVLKPKYIPYREGVAKLLEGELISFAISPYLSVVANESGGGTLMFALREVGNVDENGNLSCNIPTINILLEEEE